MAIPVTCDCGKSLRVKDEYAGKRVRCPACGKVLFVPASRNTSDSGPSIKPRIMPFILTSVIIFMTIAGLIFLAVGGYVFLIALVQNELSALFASLFSLMLALASFWLASRARSDRSDYPVRDWETK